MESPILIKKYGNRRLYDGGESRYITLEELAEKIRLGATVRLVDAKTGEDLTQPTFAQLILESRGASRLLPTPLLEQLIRMGDDALAEFFGRYVTAALELYAGARKGAQAIAPFNPLANLPFQASGAFARALSNLTDPWGQGAPPWANWGAQPPPPSWPGPPPGWSSAPPMPVAPPPTVPMPAPAAAAPRAPPVPPPADELAALRRELDALKKSVGGRAKRKTK